MTPERLTQLKALADAATPGPWEALGRFIEMESWSSDHDPEVVSPVVECSTYCYGGTAEGIKNANDAEFIAAARTAVPELVAEVEGLQAQVQRVETMLEEMGEGKAFGILTRGREDEYPISYFIAMLEQALGGSE